MDNELGFGLDPVRGDMSGLREETGRMREELDQLAQIGDRTGRAIEAGLLRAVRTGKLGFEDLGRVAMSVLAQIAAAAVRDGLSAIGIGGKSGGGGLAQIGATLLPSVLSLPGRATGGPVSPGRAYLVGERGPEVFLPTSSGQVMPNVGSSGGRDVRVSITVNSGGQDAPRALARSARQVARAVRGALGE